MPRQKKPKTIFEWVIAFIKRDYPKSILKRYPDGRIDIDFNKLPIWLRNLLAHSDNFERK